MTTGKSIIFLLVIVFLVVALLVIIGVFSPKPVVAPAEQSTFTGPPSGEFGGFKGPTGPPPGSLESGN